MADLIVQAVRKWLQRQPYSLRMLTLLLFLEETVEAEFGEGTMRTFMNGVREAFKKLPNPEGDA